jgi:hypothetical protein
MSATPETEARRAPPALMPLIRELCDLKRVRSAGRAGSIAERLFAGAWSALVEGRPPAEVARMTIFSALAATRMGDLDVEALAAVGVPAEHIRRIRRDAVAEVAPALDLALRAWIMGRRRSASARCRPASSRASRRSPVRARRRPAAGAWCSSRRRAMRTTAPSSH